MFSKSSQSSGGGASGLPSIISRDMTVTGDIATEGVVQIEGTVEGDVRCHELTLGESGEVRGHVTCETAEVHGTVVGELRATTVSLRATAKVNGDIVHQSLSIETGARAEGQLIHQDTKQSQLNLVSDETA